MNTLAECSEATALTDLSQALGGDVTRMEEFMLAQEQVPCPVIHRFGPGVYMREVKIPAGTMAVGHHQNFEHMNIVLAGRVTILQDDGSTTEVVAPTMYVGKPGRKVGYIHEDLVWLNIYATTETDIDRLEALCRQQAADIEELSKDRASLIREADILREMLVERDAQLAEAVKVHMAMAQASEAPTAAGTPLTDEQARKVLAAVMEVQP